MVRLWRKWASPRFNERIISTETLSVRVYVDSDIQPEEAKVRIVRQYINEVKHGDLTLWEAYGKGLLQVYEIDHTTVTPPRISEDDK
jgi:hypothetical protein